MKRNLLFLICGLLCAALGLNAQITITPYDAGVSYSGDLYTITGSGPYTISSVTGNTDRILVNGSGTVDIIFNNLEITSATNCAFAISSVSIVNLTLEGTNYLKSGNSYAGLHVPAGATLQIGDLSSIDDFTGKLEVHGGSSTAFSADGGAGIGGHGSNVGTANSGTIVIYSGTIEAYGGSGSSNSTGTGGAGGAGIGGGGGGVSGTSGINSGGINIEGGKISATGGNGTKSRGSGAGIGGGGGGNNNNGNAGIINISTGNITAIGGTNTTNTTYNAPGIGSGGGDVSPPTVNSYIQITTQPMGSTIGAMLTIAASLISGIPPVETQITTPTDYKWYKVGNSTELGDGL